MAEPTYNQSTIKDTLAKIEQQFGALQAEREANTVESRTAGLNAATEEAYRQRQLQGQQAQNQFAQNTMANQMSALDAIRTSNASQIASGANAGLAAANQLSAILGLQESNNEAATNIANDAITAASERNTAMAQNAVTAQSQVDQQNQSIRTVEANLQAAKAELAKASSQEEAARESALAEQYKADKQAETEAEANRIREQDVAVKSDELEYDRQKTELENLKSSFKDLSSGWVTEGNAATAVAWTDSDGKKYGDVDSNRGATNRENQNKLRATEGRLYATIVSASTDEARLKAISDYNKFLNSIQTDGGESCVTGDTLITLADGSQKRADKITPDDLLLTFNQRTQQTEAAKINVLFKEGPAVYNRITLYFDDCSVLKILHQHHLFCVEKKRWILITPKNVHKFLNKSFKNIHNKGVKLLHAEVKQVKETRYDILAYKHIAVFAENILTGSDLTDWILKGRTKKYTDAQLVDYAYVKRYIPNLTPEIFEAFDGEMMKVWCRGFAKLTLGKKITKIITKFESSFHV